MARRRRLYAATLQPGSLELSEESRKHAAVLRLEAGDELCLFDARGAEAEARVLRSDRRQLVCEVGVARIVPRSAARLTLIVGIPKASKLELIVRIATELGVHAIVLAQTERSVPKLSADSPKLERLQRIAIEACAQSARAWAPELSGPLPLAAAAAGAPLTAERLLFWEEATAALALAPSQGRARDVWAIVGPEGGISAPEAQLLLQSGYVPVSLGSGILRMETAAIVVAALLQDRIGALR
jgi:16S rRNA (uracil1498-N3)-methyltransferase